jgi:hypothetical protein
MAPVVTRPVSAVDPLSVTRIRPSFISVRLGIVARKRLFGTSKVKPTLLAELVLVKVTGKPMRFRSSPAAMRTVPSFTMITGPPVKVTSSGEPEL